MADPDEVDDVLSVLKFGKVGFPAGYEHAWPYLLSLFYPDPEELAVGRERMILRLARYARQDIDRVEQWDIARLRRWHARLMEQLEAERSAWEED